ncbi:MAG: mechanosensitive ion channel domain-containing protein [Haloferacaceae archaeon]
MLQTWTASELLSQVPSRWWLAAGILLLGLVLGYTVAVVNRRLLVRLGIPDIIEGTAFERMAQDLGTSTVSIVAKLSMYFIVGIAVLAALSVTRASFVDRFWNDVAGFVPNFFVALLVLIVGVVVGDKVELVFAERLRGIKLPQAGIVPRLAKYSVIYIAILIALSQIEVATDALIVLLAAYLFAVIFLGGIAFKDFLSSGAAGVFLLLKEPYSIGDRIRVAGVEGIVQEMDLFVTHVESDGEDHVIPNNEMIQKGFIRIR